MKILCTSNLTESTLHIRYIYQPSFYFFFQLVTLLFSFFTFTVFLYMFRTGWSIIRRIKCFITQAASGTVPSVVDVSFYQSKWQQHEIKKYDKQSRKKSNTNGHERHINDRGNGARGCLCNKTFDSPDDGPAGPKHVEKNCKCKKGKYKCIKLEKEIKRIYKWCTVNQV